MDNTIQSAKAFLKQNEVYSEYRVVCDKLPEESKQIAELLVAYAASVRHEVVVPSENEIKRYLNGNFGFGGEAYISDREYGFECGTDYYQNELRRLNPTMTFTELNHEK